MCRRLESEEEKVLPFYPSSLTSQEQSDLDAAVYEPAVEQLAEVGVFEGGGWVVLRVAIDGDHRKVVLD